MTGKTNEEKVEKTAGKRVEKGIQQFMLGTVLTHEREARATLQSVRAAGYTGIELCRFMIHPAGWMVRLLTKAAGMPTGNSGKLDWPALMRDSGLRTISLHTDLGSLEREPDVVLADAAAFKTDAVVITGMYRFDYGNEEQVHALAARLNKVGERLRKSDVRLFYHNHNVELQRVRGSGKRVYDILIDETDPVLVNFEMDSYWIAEGGGDPLAVMQQLGNRMKLWHINDRGTRLSGSAMTPILKTDSLELGTGNMPLEALCAQAKAAGIDAVVLESHRNWIDKSPVKSLQLSAQFLNRYF